MTTAHASVSPDARVEARPRSTGILDVLLVPATMVMILGWALLLLMTPIWTHFALTLSGGINALATPEMALQLSDRTVAELIFGPATFSAFGADEAAHMRDVSWVVLGFVVVVAVSGAIEGLAIWRDPKASRTYRAIARGGLALAAILGVLGVFAAVAFDAGFELFHRLLFPGGNFAFPVDSLLIKLYPYGFWQLSAAAFGALGIAGGLLVWFLGRRKARQLSAQTDR